MSDYGSPNAEEPVDYTGLKIGVLALPIFFLVTFFRDAETGLAADIVVSVMLFAIKLRWNLRKHIWFWVTIAILLALHIPLVFMVRWPHPALAAITMVVGFADFFLIRAAFDFAEMIFSKGSPDNDV